MARLIYGHILSNGVRVHYYRTGDEKPPVILLHGNCDNGLCWGNFGLGLEPDYDVVMPDARGHGLSDAPENGYSDSVLAQDVTAMIHELDLVKPAIVGHSMGAQTAAVLAAHHPELVSCIVLEDPPWYADGRSKLADGGSLLPAQMRQQIDNFRQRSLEDLIKQVEYDHPHWNKNEYFQWAKARLQLKTNASKIFAAYPDDKNSWLEITRQIKCPVLLITADPAAGAVVTPEVARVASLPWKKSQVVKILDAGHDIRRDQPDLYQDVVARFLQKFLRK